MNNLYLGIEYSKDRVKCALMIKKNGSFVISHLEMFESSDLNTSLNSLVDWKKKNIGDVNIKAIISISESTIFLKELKLPVAKKTSLDEAVYWELSANSPLPPSQAIYEWAELGKSKNDIEVVAMAVREAEISTIIDKLEIAGIEVVAIEPTSTSLARVAGENFNQNTMLLMVGNKETDIVILKQGKPVFSTTSDVALKRDKEKWQLSQAVADSLAENTLELIRFWEEKSNSRLQQVIITGDIVDKYYGLAASINKQAKIPVVIAKEKNIPGLKYADLPKAMVNRYFVPIGAVIRFGEDIYADINLIPKYKRKKIEVELFERLKSKRLSKLSNVLAGTLATFTLLTAIMAVVNYSYSKNMDDLKEKYSAHPALLIKEEVSKTNDILTRLTNLTATKPVEGEKLRRLSELAPSDIRFTAVIYDYELDGTWSVVGIGSREAILSYYEMLLAGSGATEIRMPYSNLNNDQENEFNILIKW